MAASEEESGLTILSRRIFAIQEERKTLYTRLKRTQEEYVDSPDPSLPQSLSKYKTDVASITTSFSLLSQEMTEIGKKFNEQNRKCVGNLISDLQREEKRNLQLTVQYNVDIHKRQTAEGSDDEEAVDTARDLKKKLLQCQHSISSLLEELRYECEDFLLQKDTSTLNTLK